jgi:CheY-like chemotaxis protein
MSLIMDINGVDYPKVLRPLGGYAKHPIAGQRSSANFPSRAGRIMDVHAAVLVAEDDLDDVFLLRRAFSKAGVATGLKFVRDGQEVIDYLSGVPPYDNRTKYPLPGLLVLDLKMPRVTGFEVLEWLQSDEMRRRLPVVVLSGSGRPDDIERAYSLGANYYAVKPQDIDQLRSLVERLKLKYRLDEPVPQFA